MEGYKKSKIDSRSKTLFCISVFLLCFLAGGSVAAKASLYLSPSTGNYTVGNTFSIQVKVNSGGININAVDGTVVFDPDKLSVQSISKQDSVFTLWVQEPAFSNSLGTITFAGGKPSPGYSGAAGTVINVIFKARTSGNANVSFADGSVLADDGKGTNVLASMGSGIYTLSGREITPIPQPEIPQEEYAPTTPAASTKAPAAPEVFSSTHPDPNQWYPNKNPEFNWKLPSDVTGVSLLLNQKPTSNPGPNSDGMMESKNYENIEDGVWYFHVKFRNEYGWGAIIHRKVLIDTQVPAPFEIKVDNDGDPTNPAPIFLFKSEDSVSGIAYYEVSVAGQKATTTENFYRSIPIPPGGQKVEARAFDRAGNFAYAFAEFEVSPLPTPEITKITKSIQIGEVLEIQGRTLPVLTIRIYIQKNKEEPIIAKEKPDADGNFVLSYEKLLTEGNYIIWARAEDERGALSFPTPNYPLKVGLPPFLKFGKIALDYLTTMITLIILIVGLIAVIFYAWYRIEIWRKRVRKETKELTQSITAAFRALSQEVEEQIEKLDRKPGLSKAERDLRDKLQEALDMSERFITKEMEDIDKELE